MRVHLTNSKFFDASSFLKAERIGSIATFSKTSENTSDQKSKTSKLSQTNLKTGFKQQSQSTAFTFVFLVFLFIDIFLKFFFSLIFFPNILSQNARNYLETNLKGQISFEFILRMSSHGYGIRWIEKKLDFFSKFQHTQVFNARKRTDSL